MTRGLATGFLVASLSMPMAALANDECDFDQAYLASKMKQVAVRVPGASLSDDGVASWRSSSGARIHVAHGGCVHIGTRVEIEFAPSEKPAIRGAVIRLLEAVSTYWSPMDSRRIASALARRDIVARYEEERELWLFETRADDAFPFGLMVTVSDSAASVNWQEL
jgi:hypothetical protein